MDASEDNVKTDIEEYVVGLVDVLGQKEKLKNWGTEQDIEDQNPKSLQAVTETLLVVYKLRKDLEGYIEKFNKPQAVCSEKEQENSEGYRKYLQAASPDIRMYSFSDTVVAYSRVNTEDNSTWRIKSVFGMIFGMAVMQLDCLGKKTSLRGGVDVGLGCDDLLGDFYGPALVSAHNLESKVSQYPRITVGIGLVNLLTKASWTKDDSGLSESNQNMAKFVLSLICADEFDGHHTVDFAGKQMRFLLGKIYPEKDSTWSLVYERALKHTNDELEKHKQSERCKLIQRYEHLLTYLESRKQYWQ